jgi:hypothetical protein
MAAGAVLVVVGFIGFAFHKNYSWTLRRRRALPAMQSEQW